MSTSFDKTLESDLPIVAINGLNTNKNAYIGGTLQVDGTATFAAAVIDSSTEAVSGNFTIGGTLGVTGAVGFVSTLTVGSTIAATGAISTPSTLSVGGTATVTGAVALASTLTVGSTITATGAVTSVSTLTALNATVPPAAGASSSQAYGFSNIANFGIFFGNGAPGGATGMTAATGSLYLNYSGSATGDRAYIAKGGTAWAVITTTS